MPGRRRPRPPLAAGRDGERRNVQRDRRTRDGGAAVVAGRRAVLEAIRAGRVISVAVARGAKTTAALREVLAAAAEAGTPVREEEREALDRLAVNHHGVLARVRLPEPISERELVAFDFGPDALVVVLDGIEDPHNLGAAARAAEAAGASMLVSRLRRAAGVTDAAVRASAGALLHLPHARVANVARALDRLKDLGFSVAGLAEDAAASVYDAAPPEGRLAIVIGSEGTGMSRLVRESCDVIVGLPMRGRVDSLNASASLAAVLYAWVLASRRPPRGPAAGT